MPYRICKTFEIENGHMLSKHPDLCKFPHGHSRKVELILESDSLDKNEMVCDFKALKVAMLEFLKGYDHAICMNTRDKQYKAFKKAFGDRVIGFKDMDPTTEILAKTFYDELKARLAAYRADPEVRYPLAAGVRVASVKVWETSCSWAEYSE